MSEDDAAEREESLRRFREAIALRRRIQADPKQRKAIVPPSKWAYPGVDWEGRPLDPSTGEPLPPSDDDHAL
ncbi:MAG: hypothetical protein JOZ75_02495 [Candidatus Dormibacteraeota bacterium]|nr:hypothetical protein [Candidatus Dormibacteraeota bacterium]